MKRAHLLRSQAFDPIGGLVVNWVLFGSSGHVTRPRSGVLQVSNWSDTKQRLAIFHNTKKKCFQMLCPCRRTPNV